MGGRGEEGRERTGCRVASGPRGRGVGMSDLCIHREKEGRKKALGGRGEEGEMEERENWMSCSKWA